MFMIVYEMLRYGNFLERKLNIWEQIQLIIHAYSSMQQKREWLSYLLQQVDDTEKRQVHNMIDLIDTCLYQIYRTKENILYVAEYRDTSEIIESDEINGIINLNP